MPNVLDWPVIPRAFPKMPTPKLMTDPDERASYYALSNADQCLRLVFTVAYAEGPKAALDMIENIAADIKRQFGGVVT